MADLDIELCCTSCGALQSEVEAMISAPFVILCADCIDRIADVLRAKRIEKQRFDKSSNIIEFGRKE